MYNPSGIKYFMHITSLNNELYLPVEIRRIIWEECHLLKIIQCWNKNIKLRLSLCIVFQLIQ